MTWLEIGNGWRNLYLLSSLIQALALGCLATAHGLCKRRLPSFLSGVAFTPLAQFLWMLLMALAWPTAPRWVYIGVPPALAVVGLAVMGLRRAKRLREEAARLWALTRSACRLDKPAVASLCFSVCMALLLLPFSVRLANSSSFLNGADSSEYMALALRFCEERNTADLFVKEETEGHFRGNNHFPSLELYMSYGLFHTGGALGYPNDKAACAGVGMLSFYAAAGCLALLDVWCRGRRRWVMLGMLLINLVPNLFYAISSAPRDVWRILAVVWAASVFPGLTPWGGPKRYAAKLAFSFAACFTVMSTHVVCFVVLPFLVVAWVFSRWLGALIHRTGQAARELLRSVGMALAGAAGTLVAFSGSLWCYARWGTISPWRLMTTFTDAPWYPIYLEMEYRLEETTTHLNFWETWDSIMLTYATPVGQWGFFLALAALVGLLFWTAARRAPRLSRYAALPRKRENTTALLYASLALLLTLAPMSGVLDNPLYSFSGAFLKLPRYTLHWFVLAGACACAVLSAVEGSWPRHWRRAPWARRLPALLCTALCVAAFAQGTSQTGYSLSIYRQSRDVMEDESLLLDNAFEERYGLLMQVAEQVEEDQSILITRSGYQYPLHSRAYVLTANPIVTLLNLPLEEVGPALEAMNVALIATEPDFWDERYFAMTTLDEYLDALPPEQIVETQTMRLYLLDPSLVTYAQLDGPAPA